MAGRVKLKPRTETGLRQLTVPARKRPLIAKVWPSAAAPAEVETGAVVEQAANAQAVHHGEPSPGPAEYLTRRQNARKPAPVLQAGRQAAVTDQVRHLGGSVVVGAARRIERHLGPPPGHPALEGRHRGDGAVPAAGGLPPKPGRHHAVRRLVLVAPARATVVTVPPETRKPVATSVAAGAVVLRLPPVAGDLAVAAKARVLDPVGQPVAG